MIRMFILYPDWVEDLGSYPIIIRTRARRWLFSKTGQGICLQRVAPKAPANPTLELRLVERVHFDDRNAGRVARAAHDRGVVRGT